MTLDQLLLFVPAAILVAASPGANNLLALANAARNGFRPAFLALTGRFAAFSIMIALVVVGLGAVLERSETVFQIVKWIGVVYLAWLGLRLWLGDAPEHGPASVVARGDAHRLARREFVVAMTNPKAMLLFTAFLPPFVDATAPAWPQLTTLGAAYMAIELGTAAGYALAGSLLGAAKLDRRRARLVDRISGGMMLGAAGMMATLRRAD